MTPQLKNALLKIAAALGLDIDSLPVGVLRAVEQYGQSEADRERRIIAYIRDEEPEQWPDSEVTPAVTPKPE